MLPADGDDARRDPAPPASAAPHLKVLLVEDNADLAANTGTWLELKGHEVDYAADGALALSLAAQHRYDVIVLDRMLPRVDGVTVCRRLREELRDATPVLMLTALASTGDKVAGLGSGADDYLAKPFALEELEARLQALRRRAAGAVATGPLTVADLRYDPATMQAHRNNQALALTPVLRKLLERLLRANGGVVSRAELERTIWGDAPPDRDVLRAHIHNLRNAIDRPFRHKLLHTVPGAGYRLADPGEPRS